MDSKNENIIGWLARLFVLSACLFLFVEIQQGNSNHNNKYSLSSQLTSQELGNGHSALANVPPYIPDYSCDFPNPDNYLLRQAEEWHYSLTVKTTIDNQLFSTFSFLFSQIKPILQETYASYSGKVKPADLDFPVS